MIEAVGDFLHRELAVLFGFQLQVGLRAFQRPDPNRIVLEGPGLHAP